ncbi:MAG: SAM-dependent methyltransferase [Gammaproteobacteria bacterium]|nr:SAM-dependent methyltransferase [Gammaproteobacteria bacterium]
MMRIPSGLPAIGTGERAHVERVHALIRAEAEAHGGSIPFSRFMEIALYAPGLGYYRAGWRTFGAEGDFVTAAEISPLFASAVARQVEQALSSLGAREVIEIGAGTGRMAAQMLLDLVQEGEVRYRILELSGALASRQRETISAHAPDALARVSWLDGLPESGFRGVVLANEVVDAVPVERFEVTADGISVHCVGFDAGRPVWRSRPAAPWLVEAVESVQHEIGYRFPVGYISEIGPARCAWAASIAERMERGLVLVMDYGFPRRELYHPDRRDGTLRCHFRHRRHDDPLALCGLQDITAHVDFTAIARASGLDIAGFTTQSEFLLGCGLLDLVSDVDPGSPEFVRLTSQIKRITLPGEMGEAVKVMALTRGMEEPLIGFSGRDHRMRL